MQSQAGAPLIHSPDPDRKTTARTEAPRLLYLALLIVAVPVYVGDQLTKAWAAANLVQGQPRALIGSLLQLHLTRNSGAAFSIGTGATWVLTTIAVSVVVFIVVIARRLGSRGWALALGLLLGGSLGNLTDRMFRAPGPGRGHVVDFIELPHYPIFNIADSAIVSAAVVIAVLAFRGINIDGTRTSNPKHHEDESTESATAGQGTAGHETAGHETAGHESGRRPPPRPAGTDHDV